MCELSLLYSEVNEKYDALYQSCFEVMSDVAITIKSNLSDCFVKNYLYKEVIPASCTKYEIWLLDEEECNISQTVKELCFNSGMRMKNMTKGYYNLNHCGKAAYLYIDNKINKFFLFGRKEDCKKIFWSYIIKWIIMKESLEKKYIHIKGSLVNINNKGCLFIGGKGSGKSTLTYTLMKEFRDAQFVSNTHVCLSKNNIGKGVYSCINYRENMARKICEENSHLSPSDIKGCTNFNPYKLMYNMADDCKIDYVIFYQFNTVKNFDTKKIQSIEMFPLFEHYANGINVYQLKDDLIDYYGKNVFDLANDFSVYIEQSFNFISSVSNYVMTCDVEDGMCREKLYEFIRNV